MSNAPVEIHEGAQAIAPAAPILPHACVQRDPANPHAYPFAVYPGFRDPDDYRELVQGCQDSTTVRARQLADDAALNHTVRHGAHDHPWCYHCDLRAECFRTDRPSHSDIEQGLGWARVERGDPAFIELLEMRRQYEKRFTFDGVEPDDLPHALPDTWSNEVSDDVRALTSDQYEAIRDAIDLLTFETHPVRNIEAQATTLRRACRYLVVHGKPPVDPWPNLETEQDYDAEFLTRDQLKDLPEADDLIAGVVPRSAYGILRGRDHSFKTFVAIDWACHIATGRNWCGRQAEPGRVLYIAGEGAHGITARIAAWEAEHETRVPDGAFVVRKSALNLHAPTAAFDHLLAFIESGNFVAVFVDTLRRVSGAADGNGSEMGLIVDNIDRIKRATNSGSVFVLAHTTKADGDTRGFSGIEDDADCVWHADREDMVVEIKCTKMKDGPDGHSIRLQARQSGESLAMVEAGETVRVGVSESATKLLGEFFTTFRNGAAQAALRDGCGLPRTTYYRAIAELVEAGHVVNTGTKHRPFYERVEPEFDR